jgi:hypothetical protein
MVSEKWQLKPHPLNGTGCTIPGRFGEIRTNVGVGRFSVPFAVLFTWRAAKKFFVRLTPISLKEPRQCFGR